MKSASRPLVFLAGVLVAAGLSSGCRHAKPVASTAERLEAGVAEVDITPPIGHRMAGYFDERLATGVHDPLRAKALVLRQGDRKVALVCCDLVGLSLNVTTNARAQASRKTGIPISHIVVAATHSHTGPLFDDVRRDFFHEQAVAKLGRDPQETVYYPALLTERIVEAVVEANARLGPAQLQAGIATQTGLSFNRRYHMKDGRVQFNPGQLNPNIVRPAGPVDPDVGLLFVRPAQGGQPLASVTVFACHCDTVGGTDYSADFPYFLGEKLKGEFGARFISAFAAGTCGDINHINVAVQEPLKGFETAGRIGGTLGQTVLDALPGLDRVTNPALAVRSTTLSVPLQTVTAAEAAAARQKLEALRGEGGSFMEKVETVKAVDLAARGPVWPMEVQVFRLDADTAIVALPGEIFVDLGLAIKRASPFKRTIVMSICNDRPSYVPTRKAFSEGSYEVTNARVQPGVGEQLVEAALQLLHQVKERALAKSSNPRSSAGAN